MKLRDRLLASHYRRAPVTSPRVQRSYQALTRGVDEQFARLPVRVEFTPNDPYGPRSKRMFRDIDEHGRLKVFTGASEHPILTPEQNWKFRAVHDYYGHYAGGRNSFSRAGEHAAYQAHKKMFPRSAHSALASETEAQQAVFHTTGNYATPQKAVHVPRLLRSVATIAGGTAVVGVLDDGAWRL